MHSWGGARGDHVELQGAGVVDEGALPTVRSPAGQGHDLDLVIGAGEPARAEGDPGPLRLHRRRQHH